MEIIIFITHCLSNLIPNTTCEQVRIVQHLRTIYYYSNKVYRHHF